jgi:hypothetical protein
MGLTLGSFLQAEAKIKTPNDKTNRMFKGFKISLYCMFMVFNGLIG